MNRRGFNLTLFTSLFALASLKTATVRAEETSDALIAALYAEHAKRADSDGLDPVWQDTSINGNFFSSELKALIDTSYAETPEGDLPPIAFDVLYDAQDFEIKDLKISKPEVDGDKAMVDVGFTNFGEAKSLTFYLVKTGSGWRIDEIGYNHTDGNYGLRSILTGD